MKKKFQAGVASLEYVAIGVVIATVIFADSATTNETAKSVFSTIIETFQNLWNGFSFMVSLPLN